MLILFMHCCRLAIPGGAGCESSEGSTRVGPPQHELPLGRASYDDIRAWWLPQLCHMQASLQVAAGHHTLALCTGMYQKWHVPEIQVQAGGYSRLLNEVGQEASPYSSSSNVPFLLGKRNARASQTIRGNSRLLV